MLYKGGAEVGRMNEADPNVLQGMVTKFMVKKEE